MKIVQTSGQSMNLFRSKNWTKPFLTVIQRCGTWQTISMLLRTSCERPSVGTLTEIWQRNFIFSEPRMNGCKAGRRTKNGMPKLWKRN